MSAVELHVDDIGTQLIVTICEDGEAINISGASSYEIVIRKPNGVSTAYTPSFLTDGTDGNLVYVTVAGDVDQIGNYKIQGKVVLNGGTFRSSMSDFKVLCNLEV